MDTYFEKNCKGLIFFEFFLLFKRRNFCVCGQKILKKVDKNFDFILFLIGFKIKETFHKC